MKKTNLLPFDPSFQGVKIIASLGRALNEIKCSWKIEGISLDLKEKLGGRKKDLWKGNVFEFFLKKKDEKKYYEVHLDAFLNWNIYVLSDYRTDLLETDDLMIEKARIRSTRGYSIVDLFLKSKNKFLKEGDWFFLPPVIWNIDGTSQYFSFKHPKDNPDFHQSKYYLEL